MDPTENKDKFSTGFREVQESFYDLCGKLEKTQDCFLHFHWYDIWRQIQIGFDLKAILKILSENR